MTEVKKALALMQCAIYSGAMSQPDRAKPELFLCHSGKDKTYVRRLASDLEMLGVEPWFDAWQLSVGDSLIKRIGDGIGTSKFFCIILSVNSKGSRWCDAELSEALSLSIERGKRNILVVKKGKVDIPPFVRDNRYVDASRYSLRVAIQLACKIYRVNPRILDLFLQARPRPTHQDAMDFISEEIKRRSVSFGVRDWRKLQRILAAKDIRISDAIRIHDMRTGSRFHAC